MMRVLDEARFSHVPLVAYSLITLKLDVFWFYETKRGDNNKILFYIARLLDYILSSREIQLGDIQNTIIRSVPKPAS